MDMDDLDEDEYETLRDLIKDISIRDLRDDYNHSGHYYALMSSDPTKLIYALRKIFDIPNHSYDYEVPDDELENRIRMEERSNGNELWDDWGLDWRSKR